MDNVTHALAGCLMSAGALVAIDRRGGHRSLAVHRATFLIGIAAAEFPDLDLLYAGASLGMGKLGYMLHHRGHTHTVVFAIAAAVILWLVALLPRRDLRPPAVSRPLLWLSLAGTLSHLILDWTNSYGVHPWWPLNNRWYYGDVVFIIEPWLWIVSLPALFFLVRRRATQVLICLLLAAILVAAWNVDLVGPRVALALTMGATVWAFVVWKSVPKRRLLLAVVAWCAVESAFFATSRRGRQIVQRAAGSTFRDVVLNPLPGDPFCLRALVVTEVRGIYHLATALVSPFPQVRGASCRLPVTGALAGDTSTLPPTRWITWGTVWQGSVDELRRLAAANCEVAAALRFMRAPIWRTTSDGRIQLSDARFGEAVGGFAAIETVTPVRVCPRAVPPWVPPRRDILE